MTVFLNDPFNGISESIGFDLNLLDRQKVAKTPGCDGFRARFARTGTLCECSQCERAERFLPCCNANHAIPPPIKAEGIEVLSFVSRVEQQATFCHLLHGVARSTTLKLRRAGFWTK